MNQPSLFDRPVWRGSEEAKRDEGIAVVLDNAGDDWRDKAVAIVAAMPSGTEITGEDIRLACEAEDVRPHHHNAWGGLTNRLIRDGLIVATGNLRPMRAPGSHARKTAVYVKK